MVTVYRGQDGPSFFWTIMNRPMFTSFERRTSEINHCLARTASRSWSGWTAWKRSEVRRAMQIVIEQQDELLARWKEIHG